MTTITKERALKQLDGIKEAFPMSFVRGYIAQLEANQRQPVSDEKLRDAVSRIDDEFCSATEFNRELCENDWAIIANALSELETLRAAGKWRPIESAPTYERILIYYDNGDVILCDENDNDGFWVAYEKDNWCDTPKYWMPLPTPPAQEV